MLSLDGVICDVDEVVGCGVAMAVAVVEVGCDVVVAGAVKLGCDVAVAVIAAVG